MLNIISLIFALLFICCVIRRYRNDYLNLKYRFKFYALRDKLREQVIKEKINKNTWTFEYIDCTLSKIVNDLSNMSIYKIVLLNKIHKRDNRFISFKRHLTVALAKDNEIRLIYEEFGKLILMYFFDRHLSVILFSNTIYGLAKTTVKTFKITAKLTSKLKEYILNAPTLPEIADYNYAQ